MEPAYHVSCLRTLCQHTASQRTMWSLGKYSYGAGVARALLRQASPQPPSLSNFTENRSRYKLALLFVSRLSSSLTDWVENSVKANPPVSSNCQLSASLVKAKVLQRSPTHIKSRKTAKICPACSDLFWSSNFRAVFWADHTIGPAAS